MAVSDPVRGPRLSLTLKPGGFITKKYAKKNRKTTVKESLARPVVTGR